MSAIQNLTAGEAIEKLRELVKASSTCMFGSDLSAVPFHVCPMQIQQVDDNGHLWIFSSADSQHNAQINTDPRVQLLFSNNSNYQYLSVFGEAEVLIDRAKTEELWDATVKAWFPEGKEDPNLTLIRVVPQESHYWATKDGKIVSLAKMIGAAVTGTTPDVGVHGDLNVK